MRQTDFEVYISNGNEPTEDKFKDSIKSDDISKSKLRKLVNRLENNKDLFVYINEDKLVKSRTRFENKEDKVIIWDYSIPVEVYDELYRGTDRLCFPEYDFFLKDYHINKFGHVYFVFEHDYDNIYINSYYFEFLENKKKKGIKKFEEGKYYKWVGPKERPEDWNCKGRMDFMLDGKPHLCVSSGFDSAIIASFSDDVGAWAWHGAYEYMIEVSEEEIKTPEGKNKGREKEMSKFEQTVSQTVGANKKAAKTAAMIKVGGTANKTVSDIIRKNLPKKYQKISTNPFFELAVANAFAVGMKQFSSDRRVDNLSDAMLTASMVEITNMINFQDILSQVMEKVDTSILNEE